MFIIIYFQLRCSKFSGPSSHFSKITLFQKAFQVKSSLMKDAMSQSLIEQGFSGDIVLDYLDVDTDPMEKFESGYPYRPLVET